jgi:Rrf2 family nitric oxide-sensitive transcriptional repressor
MLLTRQSQIAIDLLIACARAQGRYVHTYDAAAGSGASRDHAAKIAYMMRRAGFIKSARGRSGGITLARPARSISIGEVLSHTQPEVGAFERREAADGSSSVVLSTVVGVAWSGFLELMNRFTIDDLIADRPPQRFACNGCSRMKGAESLLSSATRMTTIDTGDAHALPTYG